MSEDDNKLLKSSKAFPAVAFFSILTLSPNLASLVAFILLAVEIGLDPESYGGEVDTLYEALQVDSRYIRFIVLAVGVFGAIAGVVGATCFAVWRTTKPREQAHDK